MCKRTKHVLSAALVALSVSGVALAQPAPTDAPPAAPTEKAPQPMTMKGTVVGMNLSPDGQPNGLLIKTADGPVTQVNFPPHMAAAVGKAVKEGAAVTVSTRPLPPRPEPRGPGGPDADGPRGPRGARGPHGPEAGGPDGPPPEPGADATKPPKPDGEPPVAPRGEAGGRPPAPRPPAPADHPVAELTAITPDGGTEIKVARPDEMPKVHADGKIARLNYAREGQVDGAVLEDGTFVHVGPREAGELKLAVGQNLVVDGTTPPRAGDAKVIHADSINGKAIERPEPRGPNEDRGPKGPKGDRGPRGEHGPKGPKGPPPAEPGM